MSSNNNTTTTSNSAPPPTPTATSSKAATATTVPSASTRRSARVHKRDPIVAPGFGTQQDLDTLAKDLGQPVAVVQAVMASQGRGVRRRGQNKDAEPAAAAAPVNPAWADFLSEESSPAAPSAAEEKAAEEPSASAGTASNADADDDSDTRTYQLPIVPAWLKKGPSKSKKAKTTDAGSGILVQAGTLDATCIGRTKPSMDRTFDLPIPSVLLPRIQFTKVISSCNAAHALAIDTAGNVYGWGRNEADQLGAGLGSSYVGKPFLLEGLDHGSNIVDGAVGKFHSIVLDADQQLWAVGANKLGQCGIRSSIDTVPNFRKCVLDANVVQVSCGEAFSVAVDEEGYLYTCGSSEFGQLANGETGERILTANKVTFDNCNVFTKRSVFTHVPGEKLYGSSNAKEKKVPLLEDIRIGHVACGKYHCFAVEAASTTMASRVFSWGCGNYGCLGHGVQADEHLPRLVGALSQGNTWKSNSPVQAAAGSSCSMVLTKNGHVYYCGKHRSVGEAAMRPIVLAELANNGHIAEHVGGGNQTVVISTKNAVTVAWGMGPHGELGLKDKKSSAKPAFVPNLDKCRVHDLACGYGTTYYIVKKDDKDDEAAIKQLPTVSDATFIELETFVETVSAGKKK